MDPNLLSKENKNKSFLGAFGGAKDMMPLILGFGGHGRVAPPPPGSAILAVEEGAIYQLLYAKWFHDTVY